MDAIQVIIIIGLRINRDSADYGFVQRLLYNLKSMDIYVFTENLSAQKPSFFLSK